jgi:rsbT co-antagonist protein RsbR
MITGSARYSQRGPAELLELFQLNDQDLEKISEVASVIEPRIPAMLDRFYAWMASHPDMMAYFRDDAALAHVKMMQKRYWQLFFRANFNEAYIEDRQRIGSIHAQVNLPIIIYLSGVNSLYLLFRECSLEAAAENHFQDVGSAVIKLLHLDAALICNAFTDRRDEIMAESSRAVMEMSTPVTEIWDGILLLPIVGIIDSRRSEDIMNAVLGAISSRAAREFILDISGVGVVDTAVANYLIRITKAAALMGCESTISGISPAIAQTIVQLGVDVGSVRTTATMMDALSGAFSRRGIHLSSMPRAVNGAIG